VSATHLSPPPPTLGPIAAVICNYNGREHLPPCLSALRLSSRKFAETIVVDNASTDDSVELLRRDFREARVVELATNDGPCAARNRGLAEARCEWVLLVDNDAVLAPDAVAKLERAALANPDAAVIQPRSVVASDPGVVHYDGGALHYCGLFSLRNFFKSVRDAEGTGVVEVDGCVSVVLLVKRSVLTEFGGFDPAYFILFEDLDLSMRLRMAGHRILSVEDSICHHRGGTPGISFRGKIGYPQRRAFLHSRNRCVYLVKCHQWSTLLLSSPALLLYELVWALFTLLSGTFTGYLRGKWAFLTTVRRTLRARKAVQRRRVRPDRDLLVGGPLTIAPQLNTGGLKSAILAALDFALSLWWALIRRACR
jgi:GT2 family glycosyltransferase